MLKFKAAVRRAAAFADQWQWLLVMVAAPFLLFPTPDQSPVLLIIPGLWLIAGLSRREFLPRTPLNVSLLVLAIMMLISLYATYDIAVSLPKIAGLVLGFGVFFGIARSGRERTAWLGGVLVLLVLGIGIAGVSLLGTRWLDKVSFLSPILARLPVVLKGLPGAESGFQPNEVAGTLLWILPVLFVITRQLFRYRLDSGRHQLAMWSSLGATVFISGVFVLTQSRTGYIGLTAGLLLLIGVSSPIRLRRIMLTGLAVVLVIASGWLLTVSSANSGGAVESTLGGTVVSLDSLDSRLEVWSRALDGIRGFPLTGMGLNTFRRIVFVLYPPTMIGPDFDLGHAHNEFLQAALDLGLPGLIAFISIQLGALRMVWHIFKTVPSASAGGLSNRMIALGLGSGLFAHLVFGLTDAVALGARPGVIFWLLLGLIVGLYEQTISCKT